MAGLLDDLPPLHGKNPLLAALIGFFFGGIGLGLYFWSWRDFVYPVVIFLILAFMFPVVGAIPGMLIAAGWGLVRAWGS